jgi:hypothetical protein
MFVTMDSAHSPGEGEEKMCDIPVAEQAEYEPCTTYVDAFIVRFSQELLRLENRRERIFRTTVVTLALFTVFVVACSFSYGWFTLQSIHSNCTVV